MNTETNNLTAAAPELRAALKSLAFESSHYLHGNRDNAQLLANSIRNAFAAIAKAEGNHSNP